MENTIFVYLNPVKEWLNIFFVIIQSDECFIEKLAWLVHNNTQLLIQFIM